MIVPLCEEILHITVSVSFKMLCICQFSLEWLCHGYWLPEEFISQNAIFPILLVWWWASSCPDISLSLVVGWRLCSGFVVKYHCWTISVYLNLILSCSGSILMLSFHEIIRTGMEDKVKVNLLCKYCYSLCILIS